MPITRPEATSIKVQCPGCAFPGMLTTSLTAERLTLGERDDNDNNLPDILSPITAPTDSLIRKTRILEGDTFSVTMRSALWSPAINTNIDSINGLGIEQLPYDFNHVYYSLQIPSGEFVEHISTEIEIIDNAGNNPLGYQPYPITPTQTNGLFAIDLDID